MSRTGIDPTLAAAAKAKGKRPWFYQDPDVERVFNVALALAMSRSQRPVTNILLGQDEVGSGCALAAQGHFQQFRRVLFDLHILEIVGKAVTFAAGVAVDTPVGAAPVKVHPVLRG